MKQPLLVRGDLVVASNGTAPHHVHQTADGCFDENVHHEAEEEGNHQITPENNQLKAQRE